MTNFNLSWLNFKVNHFKVKLKDVNLGLLDTYLWLDIELWRHDLVVCKIPRGTPKIPRRAEVYFLNSKAYLDWPLLPFLFLFLSSQLELLLLFVSQLLSLSKLKVYTWYDLSSVFQSLVAIIFTFWIKLFYYWLVVSLFLLEHILFVLKLLVLE